MKDPEAPLVHVYLMPGLAASPDIFENIRLPEDRFRIHLLEWFLPEPGMDLQEYARRMSMQVREANPVLIGVSFGGMLVQEMTRFLETRKVIIISSVKCRREMPRRLLVARYTKLHKLLPTSLVNNVEVLARYHANHRAAVISAKLSHHTVILSGAIKIPTEVYTMIAVGAGCHVYLETAEDIVEIGGRAVMVPCSG